MQLNYGVSLTNIDERPVTAPFANGGMDPASKVGCDALRTRSTCESNSAFSIQKGSRQKASRCVAGPTNEHCCDCNANAELSPESGQGMHFRMYVLRTVPTYLLRRDRSGKDQNSVHYFDGGVLSSHVTWT